MDSAMIAPKLQKLMPKNKILVQRAQEPEMSPGGIHVPTAARGKLNRGQVVQHGPGIEEQIGVDVQKDDVVLFSAYAGSMVKLSDDEKNIMLVLDADDLLMVLRPEEA